MTSGSDDLEQELRRNLKLRRELGAEAAKGKAALNAKQRGGVAYRLGWVIYWSFFVLSGLWLWGTLALMAFTRDIIPEMEPLSLVSFMWLVLPTIALFGLGRASLYFLSGE
jgi:hypothetical protein